MPGWTIAIISIFVSITILLFFIEILGKIRINNKVNDFINQGIEYSAEEFLKMYNEIKLKKVKISSLDSCGVYVIKNISNGKNYVGQSKNVLRRVNNHLNGKGNGDVYADFKYGDDIKIFVIRCSIYELNFYEKNLIKKYDSYNNGYNKNRGNNF